MAKIARFFNRSVDTNRKTKYTPRTGSKVQPTNNQQGAMTMGTKLTNATLQELIAAAIIDDCCDSNPRFVGRPELAAELAVQCFDYIEGALQSNGDLLTYGTARQISAARGWTQQVKDQIYLRLGVASN